MEDERDHCRTDAIEDRRHWLQVAQRHVKRTQGGDNDEIGQDERPSAGPCAPEAGPQIGRVDANLDGKRPRQGLADGDGFAHLLVGEPALLRHQLALHLTDQRHRPAEAQKAQTQEVTHELAHPPRLFGFCCRHAFHPCRHWQRYAAGSRAAQGLGHVFLRQFYATERGQALRQINCRSAGKSFSAKSWQRPQTMC